MKISPKYKDRIITLPGNQVIENIKDVGEVDLKVLVAALAAQDQTAEEIAETAGVTKDEVKASLTFWKERGAISVTGLRSQSAKTKKKEEPKTVSEEVKERKIQIALASYGVPFYNEDEVNIKLEKNKELSPLIDECHDILGRILSPRESGVIVALNDYLKLSPEYIMLLCSHCAAQGKTNMHYIKKAAENLVADGITEYAELESYYERIESVRSTEGKIRRMFGLGSRTLTAKEKEAVGAWTEWNVSDEMLNKAYEITVSNTSEPNIKYMHKVISNWYEQSIKTPEEADRASEKYRKANPTVRGKKKAGQNEGGSFDTKDFFEAALQRSYSDKK